MIVGLGTDIVEIARIEAALARTPGLARRILTPSERAQFEAVRDQARFLAKHFAAKEAAVKALGTGIGRGVGWQQLQLRRASGQAPQLELSGHAAAVASARGIRHWHLSYSDERHYVTATVIAEG
jgi:holo-[acyl-carrier protein] synthase